MSYENPLSDSSSSTYATEEVKAEAKLVDQRELGFYEQKKLLDQRALGYYSKPAGSADVSKPLGTLKLTLHKAEKLYDTQILTTQDPYASLEHRGKKHKTKTHKDGGKIANWEQTFELQIFEAGESITLKVLADNVISDALIGMTYLDVDELKTNPLPRWIRIGRDTKQATDAGTVQISCDFVPTPPEVLAAAAQDDGELKLTYDAPLDGNTSDAAAAPVPTPAVVVEVKHVGGPLGFNPNIDPNLSLARESAANLTGDWRIYERDTNGRERSYGLTLLHTPDNTITGSGEAAHNKYVVKGTFVGDSVHYKEDWQGIGLDSIDAKVTDNGTVFSCTREGTQSYTEARKLSTINPQSHPKFFLPYYDLTGSWRVYYEQNGKKRSYSLELKQAPDGTLTGSGQAGNLTYTVNGKVEKNVVSYTETWSGKGGQDNVLAELFAAGVYFKCHTKHASIQEAKRVDCMTEAERKHKYFLPFQ